jgi:hypothetical protein
MSSETQLLEVIRKNIIAAAVLREAGRLASARGHKPNPLAPGARITPGDLKWAVEDYLNVLLEMQKKGL